MIGKTSRDFRTLFLLQFTKELIEQSVRHSAEYFSEKQVYELKEILGQEKIKRKDDKKDIEEKIKQLVKGEKQEKPFSSPFPFQEPFSTQKPIRKPFVREESKQKKRVLRVPKTRLPPHLQYLKPSVTRSKDVKLELGKLDSLLRDPMVRDIECHGPDKPVVVKGVMGEKKTNIILTKEEINEVIDKFSKASKIPVHQGLFKVVAGKFIFSAIVSEVTGSKFIIKKMTYNPLFTGRT